MTAAEQGACSHNDARVAQLEERVAALEQMWDALMILQRAERRARERANGTHLRVVPTR